MSFETFSFQQKLFATGSTKVDVVSLSDYDLTVSIVEDFLSKVIDNCVGITAVFVEECKLSAIAVASESLVLHIKLESDHKNAKTTRSILNDNILCSPFLTKLAFDAEHIATALYLDHRRHITHLVDLQSAILKSRSRQAPETIMNVLGGEHLLHKPHVIDAFIGDMASSSKPYDVAHRAWGAGRAYEFCNWKNASRIHTAKLNQEVHDVLSHIFHTVNSSCDLQHLMIVSKLVRDFDRLYARKPTKVKNDVKAEFSHNNKGEVNLELTRFRTRLRTGYNQVCT